MTSPSPSLTSLTLAARSLTLADLNADCLDRIIFFLHEGVQQPSRRIYGSDDTRRCYQGKLTLGRGLTSLLFLRIFHLAAAGELHRVLRSL